PDSVPPELIESTVNICGWTTFSQNPPSSCLPATENRSAPVRCIALIDRVTRSGECTVSASVNCRISPRATFAPVAHAHCLPNQPAGSEEFFTIRTRGSPATALRATSAVPSVEESSTTTSSSRGYLVDKMEVTHCAMLRASLRAGTITVTNGGFSGGESLSLASEREWRRRM